MGCDYGETDNVCHEIFNIFGTGKLPSARYLDQILHPRFACFILSLNRLLLVCSKHIRLYLSCHAVDYHVKGVWISAFIGICC